MTSKRLRRPRSLAAPLLLLLPLALAGIGLGACTSKEVAPKPHVEQVLRVRMREEPPDTDPSQSGDSLSDQVNLPIHDGLVDFDPATLAVVPAVADAWEISTDGLQYTLHLKAGVRFHNGRVMTSDDVIYSFTRVLDPRVNSKRRDIFAAIEGAEAFGSGKAAKVEGLEQVDPLTVRIHLVRRLPQFLEFLATPPASILPREVYDDPEKNYLTHPVGCGPFKLARWERSNFMELTAFGDYHKGRPKLDRVLIRFIENPSTAMQEYRAGGLDWMDEFTGSESEIAQELPDDYRKGPYLGIYYYGMNLGRPPFRGNVDLRKAVNYAVDKQAICDQIFEKTHTVSRGILPPGMPGYNPDLAGYPYDPEKAREHLAKAGYPEGLGLAGFDLWVNNHEKHLQIAQKIQSDLKAVGIPVRIRAVDFATMMQSLEGTPQTPGEALFYRYGWQADYPDPDAFLYPLLHSRNLGPKGNYSRYSSRRVDELLDRARTLMRMEERVPLYREAERIAVEEDAVWLFISNYTQRLLIKPYVKDVVLSPLGYNRVPLERVWLEAPPARARTSR